MASYIRTMPWHTLLTILVVVYAAQARFPLYGPAQKMIDSPITKIVVLTTIAYMGEMDFTAALFVAIAFSVVMNLASGRGLFESFTDKYAPTVVVPGCMTVTMYDLISYFKNDKKALVTALVNAGTPSNLTLTDETAPLLATYLVNDGHKITATCGPPS